MFLVPFNYDLFFKKVFSETFIAKAFLEDFLGVKIESLQQLKDRHRVTDGAISVEFDYRCRIDGHDIIVEMQQWHKQDVVHRFYAYHTLNTSLQLEGLPRKRFVSHSGEERRLLDYSNLRPAITIIWMVHDTLGVKTNTIRHAMLPEETSEFVLDQQLWERENWDDLNLRRREVMDIIENDTKSMGFLKKNRLIFALQINIVQNIHEGQIHPKYARWFSLAAKTQNENNTEGDFVEFEREEDFKPVYLEIKRRLSREGLNSAEEDYLSNEQEREEEILAGYRGIEFHARNEGKIEGIAEGKAEALVSYCEEGLISFDDAMSKLNALEQKLAPKVYRDCVEKLKKTR